jgi:hypothetical protein
MSSNYSNIVNKYSQVTKEPINERYQREYFTPDGTISRYTIRVGALQATGYGPTDSTKKAMRQIACQAFVDTHPEIKAQIPPSYKEVFDAKPGIDYLTYSRDHVLPSATIHINDPTFFDQEHTLVAFDSEGADPPVLAQLCADPAHVYLFHLPEYMPQIVALLRDTAVTKVVCDGAAEEKFFKFPLQNTIDIQGPDRKSLVTRIREVFGVELKKNKHIHMRGWHAPFTEDQREYAAADAIWTLKVHLGDPQNNIVNINK